MGRTVFLPDTVRSCVSLAPSITESICFLGLGSRLTGVTRFCDYPKEARQKTVVGDMRTPDIERILSLKPDVVFLSVEGNTRETFELLERAGLRIFVSNPRTVDGILSSLERIDSVLGAGKSVNGRVDALRQRFKDATARRAEPSTVLMIISVSPLIVAGGNTFLDEIIARAGGRNAAHELSGNYPVINREALLGINPDWILMSDDLPVQGTDLTAIYPEWSRLAAVTHDRVRRVDADIFLRPGPRLVLGLEKMRDLFASERLPK